jgi:D-alanyl-D-alanine carboxypeptidase (penicillin-binding protein 5/6)
VSPDGHLSPFPQSLSTPRDPIPAPKVSATGAILADLDTGTVLFEEAADAPRPIASLTKVMTALLVLERTELDDTVVVDRGAVFERGDYGWSSTVGLHAGERRSVRELLEALLLGSANDAAEALAIHVSGSVDAFVRAMNRRADALGMDRTDFRSPHGLDDRGRSTPRDLLTLARAADAEPGFAAITRRRFATIGAPGKRDRRVQNRNALLWLYPGAFGTKTGYTALAGPSVIASAAREDRRLVAVVLDAEDEPFTDAAALLDHGFAAFDERTLVETGVDAGEVAIDGGTVPAVAADTLVALVPADARITYRVEPDPDAAFPPAPGERVGTMRVRADGLLAGEIALVAGDIPAPEPLEGAWWGRGLQALGDAASRVVSALTGS